MQLRNQLFRYYHVCSTPPCSPPSLRTDRKSIMSPNPRLRGGYQQEATRWGNSRHGVVIWPTSELSGPGVWFVLPGVVYHTPPQVVERGAS